LFAGTPAQATFDPTDGTEVADSILEHGATLRLTNFPEASFTWNPVVEIAAMVP
jgi:hypothetical protein